MNLPPRLRVEVPANPWQGRINARSGVDRRGRVFKQAGYREYQDLVIEWTRAAVKAQGVTVLLGPAVVSLWFYLDRRAHRYGLPPWCPDADIDGPIKATQDGLRSTFTRRGKTVLGGGALGDDVQIVDEHVHKRVGEPRAVVIVRAWVG